MTFDIAHCHHVYADAGLLSPNPSPIGGTFAYCYTDTDDEFMAGYAGVILTTSIRANRNPKEVPQYLTVDENNRGRIAQWDKSHMSPDQAELMALIWAIGALRPGWSGKVYSDNQSALERLFGKYEWNGIPKHNREYGEKCVARLGKVEPILLNGHPSRKDLISGLRTNKNGITRPCSVHNKWCDTQSTLMKKLYREQYPQPNGKNKQMSVLQEPAGIG